jgi:hypothetical protein
MATDVKNYLLNILALQNLAPDSEHLSSTFEVGYRPCKPALPTAAPSAEMPTRPATAECVASHELTAPLTQPTLGPSH